MTHRTLFLVVTLWMFGSGLAVLSVTLARCGWQTTAYVGSSLISEGARAYWMQNLLAAPCPTPPLSVAP